LPAGGSVVVTMLGLPVVVIFGTGRVWKPSLVSFASAAASFRPATVGTVAPRGAPCPLMVSNASTIAPMTRGATPAAIHGQTGRLRRAGGYGSWPPVSGGPYWYGGIAPVAPGLCSCVAPSGSIRLVPGPPGPTYVLVGRICICAPTG